MPLEADIKLILVKRSASDPEADIVKTRKFLFYIPVRSTRIEKI